MTATGGEWFAGRFTIGEEVDITGWLGDNNFQWAWASARRRRRFDFAAQQIGLRTLNAFPIFRR